MARDLAALRARLRGETPTIRYFHQADDPYSHLAAQVLPRLRARYAARIEICLVPPPEDSAAPDRARLRAYGLRDAQRLARARSERDALAAQADALGDDLEFAQTDEYVMRIARDELNMIMPDEVRYVNATR